MTEPDAFINDTFVPASRAALPIADLALQRGYGVFDFFKTIDHRAIFLDDHLARLYRSAGHLRLPIERSPDELKSILADLIKRNAIPDSGIRITVTGGLSPDGYSIGRPNLIITQKAMNVRPAPLPRQGIRLMTYAHRRQIPAAKTLDYLVAIWLAPMIRERGADDVLYHDHDVISECPRCNVFIVTTDGTVVTPGRDILMGVTRKHVLELAGQREATEERDVTRQDLERAVEVFVTSTTKGVLPVAEIDGQAVGSGEAGPVTRWLCSALAERVLAATR